MKKLFHPESIVIIGLSSRPSNIPRITLENLLRWGYRGRIFGVNSKGEDVHVDGIRMYLNREALPEAPDLKGARKWMKGRTGDLGEEGQELLDRFGIPAPKSLVARDGKKRPLMPPGWAIPW